MGISTGGVGAGPGGGLGRSAGGGVRKKKVEKWEGDKISRWDLDGEGPLLLPIPNPFLFGEFFFPPEIPSRAGGGTGAGPGGVRGWR